MPSAFALGLSWPLLDPKSGTTGTPKQTPNLTPKQQKMDHTMSPNRWLTSGASWASLGVILGHLGPAQSYLELSWSHLGLMLGHVGLPWASLGPAWGQLGLVWGDLGPAWASLAFLGTILQPFWRHLEGILRPFWGEGGASLRQFSDRTGLGTLALHRRFGTANHMGFLSLALRV